jgi:hypothetical protein
MKTTALQLLPENLASRSISSREIVLPLKEALEAISILEKSGKPIAGWEGWVKTKDGRVGHGNAPQGTVNLSNLPVHEAAEFCRHTMQQESILWQTQNNGSTDELHFCITMVA